MGILKLFDLPSSFFLLLASPGWGKTSLILDLYEQSSRTWIYISPLRALAIEFGQRASNLPGVQIPKGQRETHEAIALSMQGKRQLVATTAEALGNYFFEALDAWPEESFKPIVVLDEFHLFYHWGEDFRPWLWEFYAGLGAREVSTFGLSATVEEKLLATIREDVSRS